MLVTLNDVLRDARKNKYAVGLFNTVNLEMAQGVLAAAEEARSPVIIGTAEILLPYASLEELSYFLLPMAKKASVPVVVHYDHGLTEEKILEAMRLGYSSIMYDCSTVSYEENVSRVKRMTEIAHALGITVEGELGHVGANAGNDDSIYTEPEQALDFATRTGVDALAVAIGTAHGMYKSKPKLDIARLQEIFDTVDVPLVLHGGSGLSDEDFKNCVAHGVSKVNIFTDINNAEAKALYDKYTPNMGITDAMNDMANAVKQNVLYKMALFGSVNKA